MIIHQKYIVPSEEDQLRLEKLGTLKELLFFDIETTGFHRVYDHIISITFMYFEEEQWCIKQLFAETKNDEASLLIDAKSIFDVKNIHITYNGNAFDIPFLNIKYNYYNISATLNKSKSYDLYRIAKKALTLESYKLKYIESHLGIDRLDQISGLECIENYKKYLATKDNQYAKLILDHNFEDVLNLLALTKVIDYLTPEMFAEFRIQYFQHKEELFYFYAITSKIDYLEISLWKHKVRGNSEARLSPSKVSFYYENGTQLIEDSENNLLIKLPIYLKRLNDENLLFLDYESFTLISIQDKSKPSHQFILKYNQFYIYDNLVKIIIALLDGKIQ